MKLTRSILLLSIIAAACGSPQRDTKPSIAFLGASVIDGSGADPISNGVLIVSEGRVVAVGKDTDIEIPAGAEVRHIQGKFIVPGLINAHGHVGEAKGIEGGHYSRENVIDNLAIYASYGITTVVSLGGDGHEAVPLRAVNDSLPGSHARLYIAGEVITGKTPAEAIPIVDRNHSMGVDFMKIRVDDNLGTSTKMTEDVYRAIINRSHELGYKIATHMYYLDDAKKLLAAGSDFIAHSVRDQPVDQEFISLIKERKVCYCATFTRELSTFVYADTAEFFSDPFFRREYDSVTIQPLKDPARQLQVKNNKNAGIYKQQLPTAMANLKTLLNEGVPVAFGTDSGVPTRFMGYFEHLEMAMMVEAGLTPMEVIVSASKNAAECLDLKDLGTLSPGHWADFIVLSDDPLTDIRNMKKIETVFVGGAEIHR